MVRIEEDGPVQYVCLKDGTDLIKTWGGSQYGHCVVCRYEMYNLQTDAARRSITMSAYNRLQEQEELSSATCS
jgi:hypothetical protein